MPLSDTAIRSAKPGDKPYKLPDEKGLFLLIHPNGSKYWRQKYRFDGKEKTLAITPAGAAACQRYRDIREALLVKAVGGLAIDETVLSDLASKMRALSGHYDQAARAAASL